MSSDLREIVDHPTLRKQIFSDYVAVSKKSAVSTLMLLVFYYLTTLWFLESEFSSFRLILVVGILLTTVIRYFSARRVLLKSESFEESTRSVLFMDRVFWASGVFWGTFLGWDHIEFADTLVPWGTFMMIGVLTAGSIGFTLSIRSTKLFLFLTVISFLLTEFLTISNSSSAYQEFGILAVIMLFYAYYLSKRGGEYFNDLVSLYQSREESLKKVDDVSSLMNSIPGYVSIFSADQSYLLVNKMLDSKVGKLENRRLGDMNPDSEFVKSAREFIQGSAQSLTTEMDLEISRDSGDEQSKRFLVCMNRSFSTGQVTIVSLNINELHKKRTELAESKAMVASLSSLSTLAQISSGIAHEINNPMSAILGYPELIERQAKKISEEEVREKILKYCAQIHTAAERVSGIVRNMKSMASRNSVGTISKVDIVEIIQDLFLMAELKLSTDNIDLKQDGRSEETLVWGEGTKILQILLNLVWNARDAYGQKAKDEVANRVISIHLKELANNWVEVAVIDNAGGISKEHQSSLFEHKFTTKENGLGVGLAVSKSFAESMGGELFVQSYASPTSFVLKLRKVTEYTSTQAMGSTS